MDPFHDEDNEITIYPVGVVRITGHTLAGGTIELAAYKDYKLSDGKVVRVIADWTSFGIE